MSASASAPAATERPILFSGPMVRAILAGKKTQTRRVVRNPGRLDGLMLAGEEPDWCPYGRPGDTLWVRETWAIPPQYDPARHGDLKSKPRIGPVVYAANYSQDGHGNGRRDPWEGSRWRPSIFMPRWASRLSLRVTGVRVERLQEITTEDAFAEGLVPYEGCRSNEEASGWDPIAHFRVGWDTINGKRAPWASNPWVWVVEFERAAP